MKTIELVDGVGSQSWSKLSTPKEYLSVRGWRKFLRRPMKCWQFFCWTWCSLHSCENHVSSYICQIHSYYQRNPCYSGSIIYGHSTVLLTWGTAKRKILSNGPIIKVFSNNLVFIGVDFSQIKWMDLFRLLGFIKNIHMKMTGKWKHKLGDRCWISRGWWMWCWRTAQNPNVDPLTNLSLLEFNQALTQGMAHGSLRARLSTRILALTRQRGKAR